MLLVILMMGIVFHINFLLTCTQVPRLRKAFANNSLTNIKLSKNQFRKIGQSVGFSFR